MEWSSWRNWRSINDVALRSASDSVCWSVLNNDSGSPLKISSAYIWGHLEFQLKVPAHRNEIMSEWNGFCLLFDFFLSVSQSQLVHLLHVTRNSYIIGYKFGAISPTWMRKQNTSVQYTNTNNTGVPFWHVQNSGCYFLYLFINLIRSLWFHFITQGWEWITI